MRARKLLPSLAMTLMVSATIPAGAAPVLKANVIVDTAIVTVGDMFSDAGINAERALFRAPAPGKAGTVDIGAVSTAAIKAGIGNFDRNGITEVRVVRNGVAVSEQTLKDMIDADLRQRGILSGSIVADTAFDRTVDPLYAAPGAEPVHLAGLSYAPGSGSFTARFLIAGNSRPLDIGGRINLMMDVPHLRNSLPQGAILSADDIEMRPVMLAFAQNGSVASPEQLIGLELQHAVRAGTPLKSNDVAAPQLIKRNDLVTLYYRRGALTLTIKGQALNSAAQGEAVAIMNIVSKKIVNGIAVDRGAAEIDENLPSAAGGRAS